MAAQGGVLFQEKVSRLLSRENGKPVLKPNRPLVLKDSVANKKPKKGGKNRAVSGRSFAVSSGLKVNPSVSRGVLHH